MSKQTDSLKNVNMVTRGRLSLRVIRTALHHLCQRLHRRLLCTLEATLGQEGTDHHLQGPPSGQMVVLCRTGSCLAATPALKRNEITCDLQNKKKLQ